MAAVDTCSLDFGDDGTPQDQDPNPAFPSGLGDTGQRSNCDAVDGSLSAAFDVSKKPIAPSMENSRPHGSMDTSFVDRGSISTIEHTPMASVPDVYPTHMDTEPLDLIAQPNQSSSLIPSDSAGTADTLSSWQRPSSSGSSREGDGPPSAQKYRSDSDRKLATSRAFQDKTRQKTAVAGGPGKRVVSPATEEQADTRAELSNPRILSPRQASHKDSRRMSTLEDARKGGNDYERTTAKIAMSDDEMDVDDDDDDDDDDRRKEECELTASRRPIVVDLTSPTPEPDEMTGDVDTALVQKGAPGEVTRPQQSDSLGAQITWQWLRQHLPKHGLDEPPRVGWVPELMTLPRVRDVAWSPWEKEHPFLDTFPRDVSSLMVQVTGEPAPQPCNRCKDARGPFAECIMVARETNQRPLKSIVGCANCFYHFNQTYCTHKHWGKKRAQALLQGKEPPPFQEGPLAGRPRQTLVDEDVKRVSAPLAGPSTSSEQQQQQQQQLTTPSRRSSSLLSLSSPSGKEDGSLSIKGVVAPKPSAAPLPTMKRPYNKIEDAKSNPKELWYYIRPHLLHHKNPIPRTDFVRPLLKSPRIRNLEFNAKNDKSFVDRSPVHVAAMIIQLTGERNHRGCLSCRSGHGLFADCVAIARKADSGARARYFACANCLYHGQEENCSVRTLVPRRKQPPIPGMPSAEERKEREQALQEIMKTRTSITMGEIREILGVNRKEPVVEETGGGDVSGMEVDDGLLSDPMGDEPNHGPDSADGPEPDLTDPETAPRSRPLGRRNSRRQVAMTSTDNSAYSRDASASASDEPAADTVKKAPQKWELEKWEMGPGVVRTANPPDAEMAWSNSFLSSGHVAKVASGLSLAVETIKSGNVLRLATTDCVRLCSLVSGKLRVHVGDEPEFVVGPHGLFKIEPGLKCVVFNRLYIDAVLHITSVPET